MDIPIYLCIRCNKSFKNNKSHLRKHLLRKFPCDPCAINRDIPCQKLIDKLNNNTYNDYYQEKTNEYKCPYCIKYYKHQSSMIKHRNICEYNPKNINNKQQQLQSSPPQQQTINNINNTTNNTTNNIQNNNNNIHIHINGFNNEDLTKIDFDKLLLLNKDEFNNSTLKDKANNHAHNILSILSDVINEPSNKNFRLVNKKEKKFLIKNQEDNTDFTNLDYVNNHFYYLVNDTYKDYVSDIQHYERFLNLIDTELNEFEKGNKTKEATQYYSFIKKLKKFIKEKIFWTAEEDKRNNVKSF